MNQMIDKGYFVFTFLNGYFLIVVLADIAGLFRFDDDIGITNFQQAAVNLKFALSIGAAGKNLLTTYGADLKFDVGNIPVIRLLHDCQFGRYSAPMVDEGYFVCSFSQGNLLRILFTGISLRHNLGNAVFGSGFYIGNRDFAGGIRLICSDPLIGSGNILFHIERNAGNLSVIRLLDYFKWHGNCSIMNGHFHYATARETGQSDLIQSAVTVGILFKIGRCKSMVIKVYAVIGNHNSP